MLWLSASPSSAPWTRLDLARAEVVTMVKKLADKHHSAALAQLASRVSAAMRISHGATKQPETQSSRLKLRRKRGPSLGRPSARPPVISRHPTPRSKSWPSQFRRARETSTVPQRSVRRKRRSSASKRPSSLTWLTPWAGQSASWKRTWLRTRQPWRRSAPHRASTV